MRRDDGDRQSAPKWNLWGPTLTISSGALTEEDRAGHHYGASAVETGMIPSVQIIRCLIVLAIPVNEVVNGPTLYRLIADLAERTRSMHEKRRMYDFLFAGPAHPLGKAV